MQNCAAAAAEAIEVATLELEEREKMIIEPTRAINHLNLNFKSS